MAGWTTPGFGIVSAATLNGVAQTAPNGTLSQVAERMFVSVDTETAAGAQPQTVAAAAFYIGACICGALQNTATSTVHAATLNTVSGAITTESLTTAAGATYTFTLTNSLLVAGAAAPLVAMFSITNTQGAITITSVTNAVGSTVIVVTNTGTLAFNGTFLIVFHT